MIYPDCEICDVCGPFDAFHWADSWLPRFGRTDEPDKFRLSGMEFGACGDCNKGTSAADLVASFMARIGRDNGEGDWQIAEAVVRKKAIEKSTAGWPVIRYATVRGLSRLAGTEPHAP